MPSWAQARPARTTRTPTRAKKKHHGGGLFGRFGSDLYHAAVNSPAGIYDIGRRVVVDIKHHPEDVLTVPAIQRARHSQPVKATVEQVKQDVRHPLRHPGYTFLDAFALASLGAGTAARAGAVGRAVSAGEGISGAGRALVRAPKAGTLTMTSREGISAVRPASRSALSRVVQKHVNELRNRFPDAHIGVRTQTGRVGHAVAQEKAAELSKATQAAQVLRYQGRKIKPFSPEGMALHSVAEGTPLETMQQTWRTQLPKAATRYEQKNLERQIATAEKAKKFVTPGEGPTIKAEFTKLADLSKNTEALSLLNDERLAAQGILSPEAAQAAIQKPGRVYRGARYVEPTAARLGKPSASLIAKRARVERLQTLYDRAVARAPEPTGELPPAGGRALPVRGVFSKTESPTVQRLGGALSKAKDELATAEKGAAGRVQQTGLVGAEDFAGGRYHVGQVYRPKYGPFGFSQPVSKGGINVGRRPATRLTHELTGESILQGRLRHDVPRIVAEKVIEDERGAALLRTMQHFYDAGQESPVGLRKPVAIKAPEMFGKSLPQPIQDLFSAYRDGAQLDANQTHLLGMVYEPLKDMVFPRNISADMWRPGIAAELPQYEGVRWISSDVLGGLNKRNPLIGLLDYPSGRMALSFFDAVNNVSKAAILYLKPAYAVPNIVGNTFLNLTQQGPFAPIEIARSVKLHKLIGAEDTILVDSLMGEGLTTSLAGQGPISLGTAGLAKGYGFFVDKPFRRASFLYEARRAGFKTPEQIKSLLHDGTHTDALNEVRMRANRAIIDYGDLTPVEQAIIRRVLFFYPWLKGSVRYAGEYLRDHPKQAAIIGNLGQRGEDITQQQLGDLPSWAQGLVKVGGSEQYPLTANPTAAGILSQPAQLGAVAANVFGANIPGSGYDPQQLLTPALGSLIAALAHQNAFGGHSGKNFPRTLGENIYGGWPALALYQRMTQDQSRKTYPMTPTQALLQFLIGGISPRKTNRQKMNQSAARERSGR